MYCDMALRRHEAYEVVSAALETQERVTVDGWPARLYRALQPVQDAELARWVLVFGDSSRSVVLTAVTPRAQAPERSDALRSALLSMRWHRDGVAPPSDARTAP